MPACHFGSVAPWVWRNIYLTSTNVTYVSAIVLLLQWIWCFLWRIIKAACGAAQWFYGHFTEYCIFFCTVLLILKYRAMQRRCAITTITNGSIERTPYAWSIFAGVNVKLDDEEDTSKDRSTASQHTHTHCYERISCCCIVHMTQDEKMFYYCSCHWPTLSILNLTFPLPVPLLDSGRVI